MRQKHFLQQIQGDQQMEFIEKEIEPGHYIGQPRVSFAERTSTQYCNLLASLNLLETQIMKRIGVDVHIATDDGSRGHHGLVTEVLQQVLDSQPGPHRIVCCGPEVIMEAVAALAQRRGSPCQVSLETPMACGIGICFTCVAKKAEPTFNRRQQAA